MLSQTGKGSSSHNLDIQDQISQLTNQLNDLEERRFMHNALYDIDLLVNLISQNLIEFEAVLEKRVETHSKTLQMQKDFSALLVRLQRPLFPAMVLLDSKVAQLSRVGTSSSDLALGSLSAELSQLQRVEKIMLETTSIF